MNRPLFALRVASKAGLGMMAAGLLITSPARADGLLASQVGAQGHLLMVQSVPTPLDQRNCQTLRNCRFSKGGSFRGCVSSYSCRTCHYVPSSCTVGSARRTCQRQVCDWGA